MNTRPEPKHYNFSDTEQEERNALLLAEIDHAVETAHDAVALLERTRSLVGSLLKRNSDVVHRTRMIDAVERYFDAQCPDAQPCPPHKVAGLRSFSKQALRMVLAERGNIRQTVPSVNGNHMLRRNTDLALTDDASASDVEEPTHIVIVPPPQPVPCASFTELFPAAMVWRLRRVLTFFQRRNPAIHRELPPPFLLSPDFDARFEATIRQRIVPAMLRSGRSLSMLETSRQWSGAHAGDFWTFIADDGRRREAVTSTWEAAWAAFRQQRASKEDKQTGKFRQVLVASPALKDLRASLEPPTPGAYDIPPVRNPELELFTSLLFEFSLTALENAWQKLRQIYEQEMDRRWYQDKARQGALRDSLLDVFGTLPDRSGEFVAILCYYNFPNMNLHFLERFTHNKGRNEAERNHAVPYLMRFLAHADVPDIRQRELEADRARQEAMRARAAKS